MIGTLETKQQQLNKGYFITGTGNEVILIIGSCRSVPYLNYFNDWNIANGNRFTLTFIDPFNWNWNANDERVDYLEALQKQETNESLLNLLRNTSILIHEHYANAGMFNMDKNSPKNIFQFGLNPEVNICIPSLNDVFILTRDIVNFDTAIRKLAIQDYNVIGKLSERTLQEIEVVRERNLQRFYATCRLSSYPEFAETFEKFYKTTRMFWTYNHVARGFTLPMFQLILKTLNISCPEYFLHELSRVDMYANNYTTLCEYDKDYQWHEDITPLKSSL